MPFGTEKGGGPFALPHTQKQVADTLKAETVAAELEKKVDANLKAKMQQADGATAKAATAAATSETIQWPLLDKKQKTTNT